MLTVVITVNVLIAGFCFFVAWKVWQLRRVLVKVTTALDRAERSTHRVLYGAPDAIRRGELGIHQLRQRYRQLEPQLAQAQQALSILSLGRFVWQQRSRFSSKRFNS